VTNSSFFFSPGVRFFRFLGLRRRLPRRWSPPCVLPWLESSSVGAPSPSWLRFVGSPAGAADLDDEGSSLIVALYSLSGRHERTILHWRSVSSVVAGHGWWRGEGGRGRGCWCHGSLPWTGTSTIAYIKPDCRQCRQCVFFTVPVVPEVLEGRQGARGQSEGST
jgi:hypothetical protein